MDFRKLINNDLVKLGRAADMLWLNFGDYAIHFQCQWRFVQGGNKILLASHDIYNPYDESLEYDNEWNWDVFGRKKEQCSVFDVRSMEFANDFLPLKINHICYEGTYDLHIVFDKGVIFDTFITVSTRREFYRFLDFCLNQHTVIFDEQT